MPYAYYWENRIRKRIRWNDAENFPEIMLHPIPKRFRFSSTNINYNPMKRDIRDRIKYLFD